MTNASTTNPPQLSRGQWTTAICMGLLIIALIVAGAAYLLRPPQTQSNDLADFPDDPAPAAVNSTNPAGAAATTNRSIAPRPRRNRNAPATLAETDGVYPRNDTRTDIFAKSATMTVTTTNGNRAFAYGYRGRWSDRLYFLLAEVIADPEDCKTLAITPDQVARISAVSTAAVFPEADKPILQDLYNTYAAATDDPTRNAAKAELLKGLAATGDKIAADVETRQRSRVGVLTKVQIIKLRAMTMTPRPRRGVTTPPRTGVVGDLP